MKGLFFSDGKLTFRTDLPMPEPGPGEALVKVLSAGICRTDLEIVKGYMGFTGVPGHEFVGEVAGKKVVGEINCGCGRCPACKEGVKNHCPKRSVLGILGRNGTFAEYLALPVDNLHQVDAKVAEKDAVFVEPLAAACRIVEQVDVRGKSVLVLGDGKLGLLAAQALSTAGGRVRLCGKHPKKMALVKAPELETVLAGELKTGELFDVVVEATGRPEGLKSAIARTKPRGQLVLPPLRLPQLTRFGFFLADALRSRAWSFFRSFAFKRFFHKTEEA